MQAAGVDDADASQQPELGLALLRDARCAAGVDADSPFNAASAPSTSTGASTRSTGCSPASVSIAAPAVVALPEARAAQPGRAVALVQSSGPNRCSSSAISSSAPWQRQAMSSHTCSTRAGRGSTDSSP